jgi:hypothetical protein
MLPKENSFESKKLYAKHYEHATDATAPRIFISELELENAPRIKSRLKSVGYLIKAFLKGRFSFKRCGMEFNSYDTPIFVRRV